MLRGRLYHHRSTQGSLSETRRRCRSMLYFWLPKPDGQHQNYDLQIVHWVGLLFTRRMLTRMLDSCIQERWKLQKAYQQVTLVRLLCLYWSCTQQVQCGCGCLPSHVSVCRVSYCMYSWPANLQACARYGNVVFCSTKAHALCTLLY